MATYKEYKYHKYRTFTRIYPRAIKEGYGELLKYSGLRVSPEVFLGFLFFFTVNLSLVFAFYLAYFFMPLITFFASFIILNVSVYFWFLLKADAIGRFVEGVLPDALQLMVSNMRSGLTTERALLLSARPEFGILQEEISRVGREVMLGKDLSEALSTLPRKIKSERLEKVILLIVSSIKAGGEMATILEQSAQNLRHERLVDERIRSNIFNYVIFIFIAIGVGAPLLFGLSSFLIGMVSDTLSQVDIPVSAVSGMPFALGGVAVSEGFVIGFSILSLITTAVLGSLVLGLIAKGKEKEGAKFMPFLILLSLGIFLISRTTIAVILGGLFG